MNLYRLKNKTTYTESLNTLDDREDQNYEKIKGATKPTGVHLIKLEQGYIKKQRGERELPVTTALMVT